MTQIAPHRKKCKNWFVLTDRNPVWICKHQGFGTGSRPGVSRSCGPGRSQFPLRQGDFSCLLVCRGGIRRVSFITHYVLQSVQVIGAKHVPTLHDSGRYVLNCFVYHVRDPKPEGDRRPPRSVRQLLRRQTHSRQTRRHGLCQDGHLYINGKLFNELLPAAKHADLCWSTLSRTDVDLRRKPVFCPRRQTGTTALIAGFTARAASEYFGMVVP